MVVVGGGCRGLSVVSVVCWKGTGGIILTLREVGLCGVRSSVWRLRKLSMVVVVCKAGASWGVSLVRILKGLGPESFKSE